MNPQAYGGVVGYGGVVRFDALLGAWLELKLREGLTEEDRALGGVCWTEWDARDLALCEELLAMFSVTVKMTGAAWERLRALQVLEAPLPVAPCSPQELLDLQTDVNVPADASDKASSVEDEMELPDGLIRV